MSQSKRKRRPFSRVILYIFLVSSLFLLVLIIIFYPFWFKKKTIIVPVKSDKIEELSLSRLLQQNDIKFVSMDFVSDYFDVKLKDGGAVYFSLTKDIKIQIASLQAILKQLTINGKRFNLIDFRFEKPVVTHKQ